MSMLSVKTSGRPLGPYTTKRQNPTGRALKPLSAQAKPQLALANPKLADPDARTPTLITLGSPSPIPSHTVYALANYVADIANHLKNPDREDAIKGIMSVLNMLATFPTNRNAGSTTIKEALDALQSEPLHLTWTTYKNGQTIKTSAPVLDFLKKFPSEELTHAVKNLEQRASTAKNLPEQPPKSSSMGRWIQPL